jgi:hypothetical protein
MIPNKALQSLKSTWKSLNDPKTISSIHVNDTAIQNATLEHNQQNTMQSHNNSMLLFLQTPTHRPFVGSQILL